MSKGIQSPHHLGRWKLLKHSILDTATGLEWQKDTTGPLSWQLAMDSAKALRVGGHADWRLPIIEELETLLDRSLVGPASTFPAMPPEWFWSSSSYSGSSSPAWYVNFYNGYQSFVDKTGSGYVRCVRRGPSGGRKP